MTQAGVMIWHHNSVLHLAMEENNTVGFTSVCFAWCMKKANAAPNLCSFTRAIYVTYAATRALYGLSGPEDQMWIDQLTCHENASCNNYDLTPLSSTRCTSTEQAAGVRCEAGQYVLSSAFSKSLY